MEFMDQGSMYRIIKHCHDFTEDFCRYSLYKVAKGLSKMHQNNVLHRDIKSDNILHSADGRIKIGDLGTACFLSKERVKRKTPAGTWNWIAPEIC